MSSTYTDADIAETHQARKAWWRATTELILHQIPSDYRIYYGEIEDEYDLDAAVAEAAWRRGLAADFNYAPNVMATIESGALSHT
jgi:hypothetical protein